MRKNLGDKRAGGSSLCSLTFCTLTPFPSGSAVASKEVPLRPGRNAAIFRVSYIPIRKSVARATDAKDLFPYKRRVRRLGGSCLRPALSTPPQRVLRMAAAARR